MTVEEGEGVIANSLRLPVVESLVSPYCIKQTDNNVTIPHVQSMKMLVDREKYNWYFLHEYIQQQ